MVKTNAMRMLDKAKISYEPKEYIPDENDLSGVHIAQQIGLPAEQMIFIDDSQKNVDGSIEAGLPAAYYEPGTDLSALLADLLDDPDVKMEGVC